MEPLLDRIAEASSEFEELSLVGFLHLAQRELELTGDVNRDDAAVVLIEELQLPLSDAAAVLKESPAATAARLQSAWAEIPEQGTGPIPNLLQDGLIMLEPGLELDESLVLDPSLSIITPDAEAAQPPGEMSNPEEGFDPEPLEDQDVLSESIEDGELLEFVDQAVVSVDIEPPTEAAIPADGLEEANYAEAWPESQAEDDEDQSVQVEDDEYEYIQYGFVDDQIENARPVDEGAADIVDGFGEQVNELDPEGLPEAEFEADHIKDEWDGESEPEAVVELLPGPAEEGEPELVTATKPEADTDVDNPAIEPEMVSRPGLVFETDADVVDEAAPEGAELLDELDASEPVTAAPEVETPVQPTQEHNPYAALTPESLEGSSQTFPWDPNGHSYPVTAAALLALDDDPVFTQGPSQPITDAHRRTPLSDILDGETDASAAFPCYSIAGDAPTSTSPDPEAENLARLLLDAQARGGTLIYEEAQAEPEAEPSLDFSDDHEEEASAFDLMDAFGGMGMIEAIADQPPIADDAYADDLPDEDEYVEAPVAEDAKTDHWTDNQAETPEGVEDDAVKDVDEEAGIKPQRQVFTPYWAVAHRAQASQAEHPLVDTGEDQLPGAESNIDEPTAQWSVEDAILAESAWAAPRPGVEPMWGSVGEDTQQLPAMEMIAEIGTDCDPSVVGANLVSDQAISPSVERFLDDLHGSWIAGGSNILQRPVSDVPLGGRFELADPPATAAVPPPPRPKPAASGADLTNDEAVEATYEEEYVAEPPAPVSPAPAAVWIPGMADRAFRSTPWNQIEDDGIETGGAPDLHGFGAASLAPARRVVRQSPAEQIQEADVAAFMAGGPADAPEWDGIDEGSWAHADYGPKRPKANRSGQIGGLLALALAIGVVYLFISWSSLQAAIGALGLPVHPLVVVGALAGVLGIGGISMFIGSSIPKKPKVKVVRRRRRKRSDEDLMAIDEDDTPVDLETISADLDEAETSDPGGSGEVLTDVWEEDLPNEN